MASEVNIVILLPFTAENTVDKNGGDNKENPAAYD